MARTTNHEERREVFAAAALRVIMRHGVGAMTVREVAREAGFTTGALTHYFRDRDHILIEASEYAAKVVRPIMDTHLAETRGIDALRKVIHEILPHNAQMRGYWGIWVGFWERASYNPDVARIMRRRYAELRRRLGVFIRRAQAEGDIAADADVNDIAQGLIALIDGIGAQVRLGIERIPARRQFALIDAWLEMIASGRVARPPRRSRTARRTPAAR